MTLKNSDRFPKKNTWSWHVNNYWFWLQLNFLEFYWSCWTSADWSEHIKGSIDCNAGQPYLGWDTDEFPSDPRRDRVDTGSIQGLSWKRQTEMWSQHKQTVLVWEAWISYDQLHWHVQPLQPVSTCYNLLQPVTTCCEYTANCKPYSFSGSRLHSGSRSVGMLGSVWWIWHCVLSCKKLMLSVTLSVQWCSVYALC